MHMSRSLSALAIVGLPALAGAALLSAPAAPPPTTSSGFPIHTAESAPDAVSEQVRFVEQNFGFVPNLSGVMAESPALMNAYFATFDALEKHGSLSGAEVNVVALAISRANECQYCIAGHTMVGKALLKTPDDVVVSLRAGETLDNPRLETLRQFALAAYKNGGDVSDAQLQQFLDAGFTRAQALDVVAVIGWKVMSNFAGELADQPLDPQMAPFAWTPGR